MFSKACEYAIKAMILIAQKSDQTSRLGLKEIAREINSPEAFTAKILQQLSREGLLHSLKGPNGGFTLAGSSDEIKLAAIVSAIDGDSIYRGCALGLEQCSEDKPCPLHSKFKEVRDGLALMLETTSLSETSANLDMGTAFLKR